MARPQIFEENKVLEAAMHLFWRQGYVATGMLQLSRETGLKPGSVYNAFASKKVLFLRVLEHYNSTVVSERISRNMSAEHPLKGIERFFLSTFEDMQKRETFGCLLTNTATEIGVSDKEINAVVWSGLKQIEVAFKRRIIEAREQRLLAHDINVNATALHLLGCFQGMTVIGRLTENRTCLRSLARSALQVVQSSGET